MPGLRELEWTTTYSTDKEDLVSAFYRPCLENSISYWRAVGYFSSRVLALISPAIEQFYARGGRMRLVASPALSEMDRATIQSAYGQRAAASELRDDETVVACLRRYLDPDRVDGDEERLRLRLLAGMVRDGLLDIQIAVRVHPSGKLDLYHEKIGVFTDERGDYVTFNGSPNESENGWVHNAESFSLHRSWGPEFEHARNERGLFLETWEGRRPGVELFALDDSVTGALFDRFPPVDPDEAAREGVRSFTITPVSPSYDLGLRYPEFLEEHGLREYQESCIDDWFADCRGTFALATGVGKTVIGLAAARRFAEERAAAAESTLVLVVVPTTDLADQWRRNAQSFGFPTLVCNSTVRDWRQRLELALSALQGSIPRTQCVVVTADTLTGEKWSPIARTIDVSGFDLVVIGDEMHSLGTKRRLEGLPARDGANVGRMGLSATPRRHNDEEGTQALLDYFGDVLVRIDIAQAITLGALCPYVYEPVVVRLTHDEQDEFDRLSREIGKAWQSSSGDTERFYRLAGPLLTQRVGLQSHAENKTVRGLDLTLAGRTQGYQLLYTGEGVHPITRVSQIDYLVEGLRSEGMSANKFIYLTDADQRNMSLQMFRRGDLDVLVAMKCLDEGIDIPEARRGVILASTQNPRQFVQRRGRLLRTAPGKSHASLVDVLCLPSREPDRNSAAYLAERSLVARELTRALELAEAATNGKYAPPEALTEIMAAYDLMELVADYGENATWVPGA